MADERATKQKITSEIEADRSARRRFLGKVGKVAVRFLGKVGKVAVTTSAVTLMLSAGAKRGVAGLPGSNPPFNEWH
jgi:hypothetical protein